MNTEETLRHIKEYLEEHHAEKIKYPEYIEFHLWREVLLALGEIVPLWDATE